MLVDDSVVKPMYKEPKDVGGSDGSSGTNQNEVGTFRYLLDLNQSTLVNIKFRHRSQNNGVESTIKGFTLTMERWI